MSDRRITSERAREIGRLGKKASPWNNQPAACTKKAQDTFIHHRRLRLIADIAKRIKPKE